MPLPKRPTANELGESRAQAICRFISLEKSMHAKDQFDDLGKVIDEYFTCQHAK